MKGFMAALAVLCLASAVAAQEPRVALPVPFEADAIGLILHADGPLHDELPRDGVSTCRVTPWVKWRDPLVADGRAGLINLVCVDFPGPFAPDNVEVPLVPGRQEGQSVWHQYAEAFTDDQRITFRAATWWKQATVPLTLRGVQLVATREHDQPLYSGTATGRATCGVTVKAWCPTAPYLRPEGTIRAQIDGDAVYLKATEEGQLRWVDHREVPLRLLRGPDGEEYMGAQFTVAADNPNSLPEQSDGYATFLNFSLNGGSEYVSTYLQFEVLQPRKYVITWEGTEATTRLRDPFRGTLAIYADEACTRFYYGAKGELEWRLPEGTYRTPFRLPTRKAEPLGFASNCTRAAGLGTLVILEERGGPGGAIPLTVKRR